MKKSFRISQFPLLLCAVVLPLMAYPDVQQQRDRPEINFTVIEEENGSDFENFSAANISVHLCKEKSSIDESIFPSRTVKVISGRSQRSRTVPKNVAPLIERVVAQNQPSSNPQEPEAKRKPTPAGRQKTKSVKQRQARQPSASQRKAKKSSAQLSQNEMEEGCCRLTRNTLQKPPRK